MAANQSLITINHNEGSVDISRLLQAISTNRFQEIQVLQNFLMALQNGVRLATLKVATMVLKASGTFTFSGAASASDTVIINGVTFTCVASGATGNQWNAGASATATAANLASAINASVTALVSGYVTASAASGVVTITSVNPGQNGNCMTIAKGVDAGSVNTVSGARLTGGSDGTSKSYQFGGSSY